MRRNPRLFPRAAVAVVGLAVVVAGACGGDRPRLAEEVESTSTSRIESTTTTTEPEPAVRAQAKADRLAVFADATAAQPLRELTSEESTSAPGIPIVLLVKGEAGDRVEVYLPVAPPGSAGWVNRSDVELAAIDHRIEVSRSEHRLRLYDGGDIVLDEPVGIGDEAPEPGGVLFLKELLQPPDASGTFGNYAYGFSGFTIDLASFNGDGGVMALHGTDEPDTLGKDVDQGCISLHNDVMARLVNEIGLPLGTPVEILP